MSSARRPVSSQPTQSPPQPSSKIAPIDQLLFTANTQTLLALFKETTQRIERLQSNQDLPASLHDYNYTKAIAENASENHDVMLVYILACGCHDRHFLNRLFVTPVTRGSFEERYVQFICTTTSEFIYSRRTISRQYIDYHPMLALKWRNAWYSKYIPPPFVHPTPSNNKKSSSNA
jgi:hypothetical protein